MKKFLLSLTLLLMSFAINAQVGVGTKLPNASAQLDVVANDKGILITRVALDNTTDQTTITNGNVESLLVYNTETIADVTPGYYYWYNGRWERLITDAGNNTINKTLTTDGVDLILTDSDGNFVSIALADLFQETVTSLVDKGNGNYTYTNEDGSEEKFSVTQSEVGNPNTNGTTGTAGDVYVDESTGDIYTHNGTEWVKVGSDNIKTGEGDPNTNGTTGEKGDIYIDESTGDTYYYDETTNTWEINSDVLVAADGTVTHTAVDGTEVKFDITQSGAGDPNDNPNLAGTPGDVYVDETNGDIYTHNGTDWVKVGSDNIKTGEGDPNTNGTTGEKGDIYIDESTGDTYYYDETTNTWKINSDVLVAADGTVTHTAVDGTEVTFDYTQSGAGDPITNGTSGTGGDVYVDETNGDIYTTMVRTG